jgi:DNA-directed RNA polymerase specialized sigma24 family protein
MFAELACSSSVNMMTAEAADPWNDAIRRHDRSVYLSVLAMGIQPDRAREIAQAAWTRLIEQHGRGALGHVELPGLAIRQARFIALNELQRGKVEMRVLASVPEPEPPPDAQRVASGREQIARVLDALATCSPSARKVFHLAYATPGGNAASAARELGLSIQRVRQILCETRAHLRKAVTP